MPLEITFEIEGEKELNRRLLDVGKDFKNWKPEFNKVGQFLLKTFTDNFSTQGRLLGERWPSLSTSTLLQKERMGYPKDILIRTGRMKGSFNYQAGSYQVTVGNSAPYFVYHQSKRARTKLPRRIMMKLDEKRKEMIIKIFQTSIQKNLQQRGFN